MLCSLVPPVDGTAGHAYIDAGPHLPNEVLSFWKE
jgi:hypothetical protein